MKFAICNETFQDWPFEKAFDFARACGYHGIEFAPYTIHKNAYEISAARRAEVRRQVEQAGLETVGLHWLLAFTQGYYLTSPDAHMRASTGEYLSELARLCRDLGAAFGIPREEFTLMRLTQNLEQPLALEILTQVGLFQKIVKQLKSVNQRNMRLAEHSMRYSAGILALISNARGSYRPTGSFEPIPNVQPKFSQSA